MLPPLLQGITNLFDYSNNRNHCTLFLACNGQEERSEDTEKKGAFGVDGLHKHIIEWAGGWRQFIFIGVVCRSWLELYGTESERKLRREEGKEPKTTTVESEILTSVSRSRTALDGGYLLGYE